MSDLDISVVEQSIDVALATLSVEVEASGPQGPRGIQGAAGIQNLFIQNAAPSSPPAAYVWFQTGLGAGTDLSVWFEDGLP